MLIGSIYSCSTSCTVSPVAFEIFSIDKPILRKFRAVSRFPSAKPRDLPSARPCAMPAFHPSFRASRSIVFANIYSLYFCKYTAHLLRRTAKKCPRRIPDTPAVLFFLSPRIYTVYLQKAFQYRHGWRWFQAAASFI